MRPHRWVVAFFLLFCGNYCHDQIVYAECDRGASEDSRHRRHRHHHREAHSTSKSRKHEHHARNKTKKSSGTEHRHRDKHSRRAPLRKAYPGSPYAPDACCPEGYSAQEVLTFEPVGPPPACAAPAPAPCPAPSTVAAPAPVQCPQPEPAQSPALSVFITNALTPEQASAEVGVPKSVGPQPTVDAAAFPPMWPLPAPQGEPEPQSVIQYAYPVSPPEPLPFGLPPPCIPSVIPAFPSQVVSPTPRMVSSIFCGPMVSEGQECTFVYPATQQNSPVGPACLFPCPLSVARLSVDGAGLVRRKLCWCTMR